MGPPDSLDRLLFVSALGQTTPSARFLPKSKPKSQLRLMHVVRPTPKLDILRAGRTAFRVRLQVMEFQPAPLRAAMARGTRERALSLVTSPHVSFDRRRNMTGVRKAWFRLPRTIDNRQLSFLHDPEKGVQGQIDDRRRISVGNLVT